VWRFYKYLQEFGYQTHVVTAALPDRDYERVTFVPSPPRRMAEEVLRKLFFPLDEDVLWTIPALRVAQRMMAETRMDAVLSTIPYIHDHLVGLALKHRFGAPWIADYRDPLVNNPLRTNHGLPGMVDKFCDARFFAAADLLIAVTDLIQKEWNERRPDVASKTAVIWNGYDPEEPIGPRTIPARPYRLISHFGNFYGSRTPVPLLSSLLRFAQQGMPEAKAVRIRLVGHLDPRILTANGELFEELIALGRLELVPPIPRPRALEMMMESDALLLADNNEAGVGYTVPAKLFEYLRIGRPVLALTEPGSPVERILKMSGIRFCTLSKQMTPDDFDSRVRDFLQLPADPVLLSPQFLREFNGREQARKLAGLIDRMLDARAGVRPPAEEPERELVEVE